LTKLMGYIFFR